MRLRRAHELVAHLLAAFVVTFIAAPCLHNFNHRPDHVHADASSGWAGEGAAEHGNPHAAAPAPLGRPGPLATPPVHAPHGWGSLAHFGAAVIPTTPFVVPPPFTRAAPLVAPLATAERPRTPPRGLPAARGPPAG
jgi:hypothetical protein